MSTETMRKPNPNEIKDSEKQAEKPQEKLSFREKLNQFAEKAGKAILDRVDGAINTIKEMMGKKGISAERQKQLQEIMAKEQEEKQKAGGAAAEIKEIDQKVASAIESDNSQTITNEAGKLINAEQTEEESGYDKIDRRLNELIKDSHLENDFVDKGNPQKNMKEVYEKQSDRDSVNLTDDLEKAYSWPKEWFGKKDEIKKFNFNREEMLKIGKSENISKLMADEVKKWEMNAEYEKMKWGHEKAGNNYIDSFGKYRPKNKEEVIFIRAVVKFALQNPQYEKKLHYEFGSLVRSEEFQKSFGKNEIVKQGMEAWYKKNELSGNLVELSYKGKVLKDKGRIQEKDYKKILETRH